MENETQPIKVSIKKYLTVIGIFAVISGIFVYSYTNKNIEEPMQLDSIPTNITLSGTYMCLPYLDKEKTPSEECVFGLKTDEGVYYMVNFGASASAFEEFQKGKHITANGSVFLKEALSTDQWMPYNMKGIFTITERL